MTTMILLMILIALGIPALIVLALLVFLVRVAIQLDPRELYDDKE